MDLLAGQTGRTLHPLVRESLTVQVQRYGTGYYVDRSDFFADVYGIIRKVPEKLARPRQKLGDVLLAAVLRTGKVTVDWTGTNFFAASKPVAPSGTSTAVCPEPLHRHSRSSRPVSRRCGRACAGSRTRTACRSTSAPTR